MRVDPKPQKCHEDTSVTLIITVNLELGGVVDKKLMLVRSRRRYVYILN